MPISLTPGIAGIVQGGGQQQQDNPLEGFAEQLMKAKSMQTQEAMQKLTWIAQMTKESGGRFMPDPKEVEKLAKSAGLPNLLTGGGNVFQGMGEAAKKEETQRSEQVGAQTAASQASTRASNAQSGQIELQTQHDTLLNDMEKVLADGKETPERKNSASLILMAGGRLKGEEAALMAASPEQRGAAMDAMVKRASGMMTDEQKKLYANEMAVKTVDQFENVDAAKKYWAANVNGEEIPPELQPKVSPSYLADNLKLLSAGAELGLSPQLMRDFVANKGDVSKLPNWPKELTTLAMKQLKVQERGVAVQERGVKVQEQALESENALRLANAWNALSEAQYRVAKGQGTDMQDLLRAFEAARQAQLTKNPVSKDIMNRLEDELAVKFGMTPIEKKAFMGLWTSKGYAFNDGPPDTSALKPETPTPAGDMGASLADPGVLGAAGPQARKTVEDIVKSFVDFQKNMPSRLKKGAEEKGQEIGDFVNQFIKGTKTEPK